MTATEKAAAKGCIYERSGSAWVAVLRRRGRAIPLATFIGDTQEEVSRMFLDYKEGKHHDETENNRRSADPQDSKHRV
jgi:hypothetical protein